MFKKGLRIIFTFLGMVLGYIAADSVRMILNNLDIKILDNVFTKISFFIVCILVFGIILYFISPSIYKGISSLIDKISRNAQKLSITELIYGTLGVIVGLVIATIIGIPFSGIFNGIHPAIGPIVFVLIDLIGAIIGADIFIKRRDDIIVSINNLRKNNSKDKKNKEASISTVKVLDTSVIIDGRIFDICKTGFIEGVLVIPSFVLDELRHISDSADGLKRNRGRRGLDVLNRIQKELEIETQIWEGDFPEIAEVDSKLLKLAQTLNGKVITNDYNLNKVAEFQGVPVLNINELANAVKPVVLPGEEMKVIVIKDGKEASQGVAYLDDGTMIVVEGGRKYIGEELQVIVTSVLQTAAGRMIFAKPKES